jgi:hypothetical protein
MSCLQLKQIAFSWIIVTEKLSNQIFGSFCDMMAGAACFEGNVVMSALIEGFLHRLVI